ncbi:hypothetical protein F503_05610 [Ophiostoma piceae UAMH 11346]|uniref:Uncharacterized protein n=1 Tax=Ophiostoma piceae (strain UAMH 11346) TaxID=1262450 RepID=S3DAF1_OPHP1|nr:hypothetical protein F503_05610 [Ophiostoma piceae UAMH 11346]
MSDILRTIARGAAAYGHAGVQMAVGRDRTAGLGRWIGTMYREQPLLLGLLLTWTAFVAVPIAAFAGYAVLWAAIAFGVFWAIFIFWAGLGLLVFLVPAMCIATGLSLVAFAWAAVAYYFVGGWVLALFGYESLDNALGISNSATAQTPHDTSTGEISPSNPPAYQPIGVGRTLEGKPHDSDYVYAKGTPTRSVGDEIVKASEPQHFYG